MIGMQIIIERPTDADWPPLYDQLRAAFKADENVPLTIGAWGPVRCRVLSWDGRLDQTSATFRIVAEARGSA